MAPQHLYGILQVMPTASAEDIKAAHRRLVKQHHPDTGGDPEAFRLVTLAYEILSDPEKRAAYDKDGTIDESPDNGHRPALAVIESLFREILDVVAGHDGPVPWKGDIVQVMSARIDEAVQKIDQQIEKTRRLVLKFVEFEKRFEAAEGKTNYLSAMVAPRIRDLERGIEHVEKQRQHHLAARALLDGLSFKFDPIVPDINVELSEQRVMRGMPIGFQNIGAGIGPGQSFFQT